MHTNFSTQAYKKWLKEADRESLAQALGRLAQLNQTKVYLFWQDQNAAQNVGITNPALLPLGFHWRV